MGYQRNTIISSAIGESNAPEELKMFTDVGESILVSAFRKHVKVVSRTSNVLITSHISSESDLITASKILRHLHSGLAEKK